MREMRDGAGADYDAISFDNFYHWWLDQKDQKKGGSGIMKFFGRGKKAAVEVVQRELSDEELAVERCVQWTTHSTAQHSTAQHSQLQKDSSTYGGSTVARYGTDGLLALSCYVRPRTELQYSTTCVPWHLHTVMYPHN